MRPFRLDIIPTKPRSNPAQVLGKCCGKRKSLIISNMTLITSSKVETISGKIDSYTGYFLRVKHSKSGKRTIFSCRKKGYVPPEGHWQFILMCAQIAYDGLYASDVVVDQKELYWALYEAKHFVAAGNVKLTMTYHAGDIINLKTTFGL